MPLWVLLVTEELGLDPLAHDDEGELDFLRAGLLEDLLDGRQLLVPDDWDLTLTHSVPENTRSYMDSRATKLTLPVHDHLLGQKPVVLLVLLERLGDGGGDGAANLHVGLVEVTAT